MCVGSVSDKEADLKGWGDLFVLLDRLFEAGESCAMVAEVGHVEAQLVYHGRQEAHQRLLRPFVAARRHLAVELRSCQLQSFCADMTARER